VRRYLPIIEPMTAHNLDEVHALASDCFETPWDREAFCQELGRDWAYVHLLRPRADAAAVSFASFWLVRDEAHVLNLGTRRRDRRRGYARWLMEGVLRFAADRGMRYASLEVRRSNAAARALYQAIGFQKIGERPNYYADDGEDACVMLAELAVPGPVVQPAGRLLRSRV